MAKAVDYTVKRTINVFDPNIFEIGAAYRITSIGFMSWYGILARVTDEIVTFIVVSNGHDKIGEDGSSIDKNSYFVNIGNYICKCMFALHIHISDINNFTFTPMKEIT